LRHHSPRRLRPAIDSPRRSPPGAQAALLGLALYCLSQAAWANFCSGDSSERALTEARLLEAEPFSQPVTSDNINTGFLRSYNARVITCNRKRDTKGNEIEREITAGHVFPSSLEARNVKGHFSFLGLGIFSQLRYAYQLSRENGTWIVTVPIEFHWPTARMTDRVDLPGELVDELGLDQPGQICDPALVVPLPEDPRRVRQGHIRWSLNDAQVRAFEQEQRDHGVAPADIVSSRTAAEFAITGAAGFIDQDYDVSFYGSDTSCRVPRTLVVNGMSVLNHLRRHWKEQIAAIWNRPGFEIRPRFIRCEQAPKGTSNACDGASAAELAAWDKDETVWQVRFNLIPNHRPSFKRWVAKWNHMHTGSSTGTIGHELGHYLGLDDEYGENENGKKDCEILYPKADEHYIMCEAEAGRDGAMGLYPWIITRRYAIADEYQCKDDNDCDAGEFCDKGTVTVGRNQCVSLRSEEAACSRDGQCDTGMKCQGKPVGKCIFEASVALGRDCIKDAQCVTGSCNTDGACQCSSNTHCGGDAYCDKGGLLGVGQNTCVTLRAENASCSADDQCRSPAICKGKPAGRCVTESSVALGGGCTRDAQCQSNSCNTDGVCQCKDAGDCGDGRYCDTGSLGVGKNTCVREKPRGASCSADKQCTAGMECKGIVGFKTCK
jgi:Dickkopf N-terminal cysteine-rich region